MLTETSNIPALSTENDLPKDWASITFDSNDLLDGYLKGMADGEQEIEKRNIQQFKTKIKLSTSVAEELFSLANEKGFKFYSVYLKYIGLNSFGAIYFVDEDLYLSSNMKEAFKLSRNLRQKYKSEDFQISFLFSAKGDNINNDALVSDGYFIKYEKK
jgi:hypothetical protein